MEVRVQGKCPKCSSKIVITDGTTFWCSDRSCNYYGDIKELEKIEEGVNVNE